MTTPRQTDPHCLSDYQWYFGWYCTKRHAVRFTDSIASPGQSSVKALCGAWVYPQGLGGGWSEWQKTQQVKNRGSGSMCKHCMAKLSKMRDDWKVI